MGIDDRRALELRTAEFFRQEVVKIKDAVKQEMSQELTRFKQELKEEIIKEIYGTN